MTRIRRYFDEVLSELRKVSWPTREQVRNLTVLVFAISLVVGIYISQSSTRSSRASSPGSWVRGR